MRRPTPTAERRPPLLDLFPEIAPYSTGFLNVGDGHEMYWEQSGNPDGAPILFIHGGPGGGTSAKDRRFFNPDHYRIIMFDQRGCGKSSPHGSLENNTLPHLIADIEKLRAQLKIARWHIFGGSWGSTLGLAYAQAHPDRCVSMILRGIFLMEPEEIDWFMHGMRNIFPEAGEQFSSVIPKERHGDMLRAYYEILTGKDEAKKLEAAIAWNMYECACASLLPNYEIIITNEQKQHALAIARIEAHYFMTQAFTAQNSLLNNIDRIRHIPSVIIHGRYDVICPIITAHKLHHAWPEADYIVVPDCGHSALDPGMRSRLIEATENARTIR